jgi:transforming growth factor-beta-induced protein
VDITVDNGVVHVLNGVLLPVQTVVDVALNNGFTSLATAVVTAELLPALTNPFATYTVFAPTNEAFDALASDLGTDIAGLLALPILGEVLTYHVLSTEVPSSAVTNGAIVQPLSAMNTLKLTVTSAGLVYVNQAQVTSVDINADNGVVHVINSVVLPFETVVDVALDNNFTTLATALVQEELLPTLTNPFATYTVFTPTNEAFDNLATTLGTDINGILALPNLTEVLTYHVLGIEVLSTELVAGPVNTLNGAPVTISLTNGVMVNTANVTTADVTSDNGVVHVIDAVLLPIETSVNQLNNIKSLVYPNPTEGTINIESSATSFRLLDQSGRIVASQNILGSKSIDLSQLNAGVYMLELTSSEGTTHQRIVKK